MGNSLLALRLRFPLVYVFYLRWMNSFEQIVEVCTKAEASSQFPFFRTCGLRRMRLTVDPVPLWRTFMCPHRVLPVQKLPFWPPRPHTAQLTPPVLSLLLGVPR